VTNPKNRKVSRKVKKKGVEKGVGDEWHLDKLTVFAVFAAVLKFFHQMAWSIEQLVGFGPAF